MAVPLSISAMWTLLLKISKFIGYPTAMGHRSFNFFLHNPALFSHCLMTMLPVPIPPGQKPTTWARGHVRRKAIGKKEGSEVVLFPDHECPRPNYHVGAREQHGIAFLSLTSGKNENKSKEMLIY